MAQLTLTFVCRNQQAANMWLFLVSLVVISLNICNSFSPSQKHTLTNILYPFNKYSIIHHAPTSRFSSARFATKIDDSIPGYVIPNSIVFPDDMTDEWELDCYSRPVIGDDGKKLWEILITDSQSNFRYLKPLASNLVNSRNVRKVIGILTNILHPYEK